MNLKSIRWRLPASYAAVALLAALSLGAVMLLVLNNYYTRQEREYLMGNAIAVRSVVEQTLRSNLPDQVLQDQVKGLAFLSQTQIRVLNEAGKAIADSGIPNPSQFISLSGAPAGLVRFSISATANPPANGGEPVVTSQAGGDANTLVQTTPLGGGISSGEGPTILFVNASPLGYGFAASSESTLPTHPSSQVVSVPFNNSPGRLEISHGPAYGSDIVHSVGITWAIASVIAITLAALAGWFASRQVTMPVLALTEATRRMEGGNLSARADMSGKGQTHEFQELAHSFNIMAQRMENTVSALRAFVADAAHELHTPLTALHTNLELAVDEQDTTRRSLYLTRAQEQGQRLETLVNSLLDLSKIEAAQPRLNFAPVELNQLLRQLGEQFASRAEQADCAFESDIPGEAVCVSGNGSQIRQVVNNLLENSLKFTPPGGSIALKLTRSAHEAMITVSDTGIGIPSEDLPHLFERFHRGRNVSQFPGNGLGLAITKALILAHNGSIHAESTPGNGTIIIASLPIDR